MRPEAYLRQLTLDGACERYPTGVPPPVRARLIEHELAALIELSYEAYF